MELTQSDVAQCFLTKLWPSKLHTSRSDYFADQTEERIDEEYSFWDKKNPFNEYTYQAAVKLADNPEYPSNNEAQELKNNIQRNKRAENAFNEQEFAEWEMDWMSEFLPSEKVGSARSKFGSTIAGSRDTYQWEDLEIGYNHAGKYAAFSFDPVKDPKTLQDLAAELDTDIEFDCVMSYSGKAAEDSLEAQEPDQWYDVDHSQDFEIQGNHESLDVKFQNESLEYMDRVLDILGWEDRSTQVELS